MSGARERPIIFSAPMVRAILDGRKMQTRRVVKPQPSDYRPAPLVHAPKRSGPYFDAYNGGPHWCWWTADDRQGADWIRCPYGEPGDRLWVRETMRVSTADESLIYAADEGRVPKGSLAWQDWHHQYGKRAVSPIHMPRWASRITLEVTEVRVQRLQEISEADALAEGATMRPKTSGFKGMYDGWSMDWRRVGEPSWYATGATRTEKAPLTERDISLDNPKAAFASYFNELHGFAAWDANPWVWAVTFRRADSLAEHA